MADDAEINDISNAGEVEAENNSTFSTPEKATPVEIFEKKKVRKIRAKRIAIPKTVQVSSVPGRNNFTHSTSHLMEICRFLNLLARPPRSLNFRYIDKPQRMS